MIFLPAVFASCGRGNEPEPEPEDPNVLVAQVVAVTATAEQELANELNQSVAPLDDGGFAVVWGQGETTGDRDIMTQWLDAGGMPVRPAGPLKVTSYLDDAGDSVVIGREGGGAYVAFSQVDGRAFQVKVQAFDRGMVPLWPAPMRSAIHDGGYESQLEPSLAPDTAGGVFVSFYTHSERDGWGIKCQRIDAGGVRAWGDEGIVLGRRYGFVTYPTVVADGLGGVYVFWLNLGNDNAVPPETVQVEGQHLDATGNKLWGDAPLVIDRGDGARSGYSYTDYMAVSDGQGGAIVSWYADLDPGDHEIDTLVQRVNGSGQLLWGEGVSAGSADRSCQLDHLISARDGGVFAAYRVYEGEDWYNRLWLQRLGAGGEKQWGDAGIEISNPSVPRANYAVYGYFTGSHLNLAWTKQEVPYTFDFDVVTGRFKKDGTAMDPADAVIVDDTDDKQFTRGMAYNPVSQSYFILWEDSRRSKNWDDFDIYGAILRKAASAMAVSPPFPVSLPARKPMELNRRQTRPMPGGRIVRREGQIARLKHAGSAA